jgi:hypothetical protein
MHVSLLLLAFSQASIEANLHSILPASSFEQYGLLPVVMPGDVLPPDVLLWALATDTPASKAVIATAVTSFIALSSLAVESLRAQQHRQQRAEKHSRSGNTPEPERIFATAIRRTSTRRIRNMIGSWCAIEVRHSGAL